MHVFAKIKGVGYLTLSRVEGDLEEFLREYYVLFTVYIVCLIVHSIFLKVQPADLRGTETGSSVVLLQVHTVRISF